MDPAPLHIVTGKGGAGKTTIALAHAARLAFDGGRVLVCEVEGRDELAPWAATAPGYRSAIAGEHPLFTAGAGTVFGLAVEAEAALTEYLDRNMALGVAGKALDRSGLGTFATSIAPGIRDILLIGKVYEAARRTAKGLPNAYKAIVLDAPPTGRIVSFLTAGDALADVARGGPVHRQARNIMTVLRLPTTRIHLVTMLRELAVTETVETIGELKAHNFTVERVFCNKSAPAVPAVPDDLDLPLPPEVRRDLQGVLAAASRRAAHEQVWRAVLVAALSGEEFNITQSTWPHGRSPQSGDPHGFVNPQSARPHEPARGRSPQSGALGPRPPLLTDVPQVAGTLGTASILELARGLP